MEVYIDKLIRLVELDVYYDRLNWTLRFLFPRYAINLLDPKSEYLVELYKLHELEVGKFFPLYHGLLQNS